MRLPAPLSISRKQFSLLLSFALLILSVAPDALATEGAAAPHSVAATFLFMVVILLAAKFSGVIERFGQSAVLGELIIGIILGNLALIGFPLLDPAKEDTIILFLAELGVVILLFQVGLESNIKDMLRVGGRAFAVAVVGVILPFFLATLFVGPWLLPGLSSNAYLFLGATLTATSVGITARVFRDLGKLQTPEARIVLGAAVIDDVLGLIILAVVSAIVTIGSISAETMGWIVIKAVLFLLGSILIGHVSAPKLGAGLAKIHAGTGMKFTLAICFCLLFAALAQLIGLAPIVGAFAAGLVLDPVHFRYFKDASVITDVKEALHEAEPQTGEHIARIIDRHAHRHIEDLIEPIGLFFVPIFFVMTGMAVRLETLFDLSVLLIALGVTAAAFAGKIAAGIVAGRVKKWIVGFGMVPRGEVGLIFATIGRGLGVISDEVYSIVIIMVILSTLLTPPILTILLKRQA
jgi:Kef-type K+ transport system membrane component KefB